MAVSVPKKTENWNIDVFHMIPRINGSKTLIKHISCKFECKFYGKKCNLNQRWNKDKCLYKCKNSK